MKLLTIDCREIGGRPGVMLADDEILDLAAAPSTLNQAQWIPYSVVSVLAAGQNGLDRVAGLIAAANEADREQLRRDGVVVPAATTALLPPVRRPGLLLVVDDGGTTYVKSPNAAVGNASQVAAPWHDDAPLVCAGMLGVVLGRSLYRANRDEAEAAIAGYTLVLDLSAARHDDWQQYIESKQFPGASPMGPAIVTCDELDDPCATEMRLSMNGVVVASGPAYEHADDVPARLAGLSQRYGFRPGDVICFEPSADAAMAGNRLHVGDAVQLSLDGIMSLDVTITD